MTSDRGRNLIAAVVGLGTIGGAIVAGMVSLADTAAAREVRPLETRVTKVEAVLPLIDRKLDILIEVEGQREWRDRRVVIPPPPTAPVVEHK